MDLPTLHLEPSAPLSLVIGDGRTINMTSTFNCAGEVEEQTIIFHEAHAERICQAIMLVALAIRLGCSRG